MDDPKGNVQIWAILSQTKRSTVSKLLALTVWELDWLKLVDHSTENGWLAEEILIRLVQPS